MEDKMINPKGHNIIMQDRQNLSITGVLDVLAFDEENVDIETEMGMLTIKGTELHVNKLNLEKKELEIEGEIESLVYNDGESFSKKGNSFLGKLFK
ncbi:sporulation protein YabP [Defluviitalea saccharophila]|jgi:sporulation protein YabP|uniref:Sporulation protein YabP n=1 Tax=Defluviitalea saccharophila TaxID=879970 RepID=A0ABZ2Y1N4_9FIRM|nr:sporulation protein YabP [Candidatus Epulonipiscium sp.]